MHTAEQINAAKSNMKRVLGAHHPDFAAQAAREILRKTCGARVEPADAPPEVRRLFSIADDMQIVDMAEVRRRRGDIDNAATTALVAGARERLAAARTEAGL